MNEMPEERTGRVDGFDPQSPNETASKRNAADQNISNSGGGFD